MVLEVRVELCQLREQLLFVVVLGAGWSTLSHLFFKIINSNYFSVIAQI